MKNKKEVDEAFSKAKENIHTLLKHGYVLTIKYFSPPKPGGGFHLRIDKLEEK